MSCYIWDRTCNSVVKSQSLYGLESYTEKEKEAAGNWEEKKILKKMSTDGTRKKHEELYKYSEKIADTMRTLKFYGCLIRVDENRLTKKIFECIVWLKAVTKYAEEVKKSTEEVGTTVEVIQNREEFRSRIDNFKQFQ